MPETMMSRLDKMKNTIVFLSCIAVWCALFCSGIIVGTKAYRDQLSGSTGEITNVFWLVWCWVVVFVNYGVSNLIMLCCIASVIGGLTHQTHREHVPRLLSRGLFVYLVFASSTIILDTSSLADFSRDKYIRMALWMSLFAYTVGFKPELFEKMMAKSASRVEDAIERSGQTTETTTTQTAVVHTEEVKTDKPTGGA